MCTYNMQCPPGTKPCTQAVTYKWGHYFAAHGEACALCNDSGHHHDKRMHRQHKDK